MLRAIRPADAADIVDICAYDGVTASNVAEARAVLRRIEADAARGDTVHWGVCLAGSGTLVVAYGFEHLRLAAIEARTAADNAASIALLRRLGFEPRPSDEALLRFVLRPGGRRGHGPRAAR